MPTQGDGVTKATIVAQMESVRNTYNSSITWGTNNQPFQTDITGGDTGGWATQSFAGDISDINITASTITNNFRSYATLLSRIRNVRLLKWYQNGGDPRSSLTFDSTQLANLNSNYQVVLSGTGSNPVTDNIITASGLDTFVGQLSTAINNNRTNTITIEEFYCHSNCHGNCHGSI